jgi:hypothetical protein
MATRSWYKVHPDRLVHGIQSFTDEQILERLERGENWRPFNKTSAEMAAEIMAETTPAKPPVTYWGAPYMPEFEMKDN